MRQDEQLIYQAHRTAREIDFHSLVNELRRTLVDAILQRDYGLLTDKFLNSRSQSTFSYLQTGNVEIYKFNLVYLCSLCVELAAGMGLPGALVHDLKDEFFYRLAMEDNIQSFPDILEAFFLETIQELKRHDSKKYSHHVKMAVTYIYRNIYQTIHPRDVAEYLHMDRTYLAKLFKKETGQTLTEYIHSAKMHRARMLLAQRIYTLTEVAEMLGYKDYSHFHKYYKKYVE